MVTLDFLTQVRDLVNKETTIITTYGEAFQVLEFLAKAKAVELEPAEKAGVFKIRKGY